jgi:hypothetical protein
MPHFFDVAFAQDISSTVSDASSSASATSSSSTAGTSLDQYIATSTTGVPATSTPTGTIAVNTTAFQNVALPSSTPDDVLGVLYSTDGVNWLPLVNINENNWQTARYSIPIHSWTELEHLQIAFVGLGRPNVPQIYLDAVGVEVSYFDTPEVTPTVTPTPAATTTPNGPAGPTSTPGVPSPAQAFNNVFSPAATQQCEVTPFSDTVARGGTAAFLLTLVPPASSTIPSSSLLYDASLGTLPAGLTGYITSASPGHDTIAMQATSALAPGSYNVVVVYHEKQNDGSVLPNYCQFNVVAQ